MDWKVILKRAVLGLTLIFLGAVIGRFVLPAKQTQHTHEHNHSEVAEKKEESKTVWTCSMHPQIQQPKPGKCAICAMDLIPLVEDANEKSPRTLTMSPAAKELAKIETVAIERRFPEAEIHMVGEIDYDETRVKAITARFAARIDNLYVNFTGIGVAKGDHLAEVYSPDLLTAQSELLTAVKYDPKGSTAEAAREKLLLMDLIPEEIKAIEENGIAQAHFEIRAPLGGVVVEKQIKEGDYVKTGMPLFKIADLNKLWVYLDAYESDLVWLRYGQQVIFEVEAFKGETFEGRILFIDPIMNRKTRTARVRVEIDNSDGRLKPGMFVRSKTYAKIARGGKVFTAEYAGKWVSPMHPEIVKDEPGPCDICGMDLVPAENLGYVASAEVDPPLIVPTTAVLRTGKRSVVYLSLPGKEKPTYEGREIILGPRAGNYFIVKKGLNEGDRVVTNGAFKIDSALQIKAKPSMMSPVVSHGTTDSVELSLETVKSILPAYLELQQALANDDLNAAKTAIANVKDHQDKQAIDKVLTALSNADSLNAMRRPHFETLTKAIIPVLEEHPEALDRKVFKMHCPMAFDDHGADWLQIDDKVRNPYFGDEMLECGEVKTTIAKESKITIDVAKKMLPAYLELQAALANDDLDASHEAVLSLTNAAGTQPELDPVLTALANAKSLNAMRRPHFETLTKSIIPVLEEHSNSLERQMFKMHCPMAFDDHGADWLQTDDKVRNPYFGDEMLECGEVKTTIGPTGKQ